MILRISQPARIWRKVIKQRHPGAVSMKTKNDGAASASETGGSKFSTTWRPTGDYIHLKITFMVQNSTVQVCYHYYLEQTSKLSANVTFY